MGNVGHHVFVGTDARGQDLGNVRIGNGRKSPVDGPGCIGGPFGVHFPKCVHKSEDSIFIVLEDRSVIPRLNPSKGHGSPVGETQGEHDGGDVRTKGDNSSSPAYLNPGLDQLFGTGGSILVGT